MAGRERSPWWEKWAFLLAPASGGRLADSLFFCVWLCALITVVGACVWLPIAWFSGDPRHALTARAWSWSALLLLAIHLAIAWARRAR